MRLIDADELIRNLEGIISDYTSNGIYPEKFGIDDFIDVVKEIPTLPAPQWIRVEERLPGWSGDYICVSRDKNGREWVIPAEWSREMKTWFGRFGEIRNKVTHWMPLPEPPKERYKCRYADDNGVCDKFTESEEIVYCTGGPCLYYTRVEV